MKKLSRRDKLRKKILKDHVEVKFTNCIDCVFCDECTHLPPFKSELRPCRTKTMFKKRPEFHYTITERIFYGKNDIYRRFIVKDNYKDEVIYDLKDSPYTYWVYAANNSLLGKGIFTEYNSEHTTQRVKRLKDL